MAEDVSLPDNPPMYDVAIAECSVLPGVQLTQQESAVTSRPTSELPMSIVSSSAGEEPARNSLTEEEARAMPVLQESRWMMEDLTVEGADSLLRMCGADGSFIITNTDNPNAFLLFCRRASYDGSIDQVEQIPIEKSGDTYTLEGQSPRPSLQAVAALFLHISPHKHCPMFVNREVFVNFSRLFRQAGSDWVLCGDSPAPTDVPHNPVNMNDWYFPALTNEQANYMLMQHGTSNCFVVSNMGMTEHYEMSTRQKYEGVEQEIVEHLRITFDSDDNTFRIAGDVTKYPSLNALISGYRESNPYMKPLFERQDDGASRRDSLPPDDDVMAPPDYGVANTLPNPDEIRQLPQVPGLTISEPVANGNGAENDGEAPSSSQVQRSRQSTNVRRNEKCCIIL